MIICPRCGEENKETNTICRCCGAELYVEQGCSKTDMGVLFCLLFYVIQIVLPQAGAYVSFLVFGALGLIVGLILYSKHAYEKETFLSGYLKTFGIVFVLKIVKLLLIGLF